MKRAMTVTYRVENGLYVNMTNRCTNSCDFCIRNNGDGAYGSESLWLSREPSVEEAVVEILSRIPEGYSELVFCGYGEPSVRLHDCRAVALAVKEKYPTLPVRINTNGHSDLIFGEDTAPLYKGAFDTVSISLNAPTPEEYLEIKRIRFTKTDSSFSFSVRQDGYERSIDMTDFEVEVVR